MKEFVFKTSNGEEVPIIIETRRGLRNITLRPKIIPRREIRISKPRLVMTSSATAFVEKKRNWLERFFYNAPKTISIKDGDTLVFLGKKVLIRHNSTERSNFYLPNDDDTDEIVLIIGGTTDMISRRVRDFIKTEFLAEVKKIIKSAPAELRPKKLTIRDTTSRWGSCSSVGTISFSWRLALAPYEVMRYVVIHELAHRVHMDHSVHFWALVSQLYGDGVGRAKLWLKKNGQSLYKYF